MTLKWIGKTLENSSCEKPGQMTSTRDDSHDETTQVRQQPFQLEPDLNRLRIQVPAVVIVDGQGCDAEHGLGSTELTVAACSSVDVALTSHLRYSVNICPVSDSIARALVAGFAAVRDVDSHQPDQP